MDLKGNNGFFKACYFLRTYIFTLKRFELFHQLSLVVVMILETNVYLLLKRDQYEGYNPPYTQDWILIATGGTNFVFGTFVSWIGKGRRHFALSGWLGVTAAASLMVLAFPSTESNPASVELCGGQTISNYLAFAETKYNARTTMLVVTALLCSLTKISIWAHGLTYLDDHEPQKGPAFYGNLVAIQLTLGISGASFLQPASVAEHWWTVHLSLSMVTLMFSLLFTLFPNKMSQWKEEAVLPETDFMASLQRVVCNKTIVLQTIALACLNTAIFGFAYYEKDYVQARFHIDVIRDDPRTSRTISDIFQALLVICFLTIFKLHFSDRHADGVKIRTASKIGGIVGIVVCVLFAVLACLSCTLQDVQGSDDGGIQPDCSLHCGCDSEVYSFSPVCGLDTKTTFFSPCTAGCERYEDLNGFLVFQNCTCGLQNVVRGACSLSDCLLTFSTYQVVYTVIIAISGASFLMQGMTLLRAVERVDKPVAIGFSLSVIGLLYSVIGRFFYLIISGITCNFSSLSGECLLHHSTLWTILVVSLTLTLISSILSLISSYSVSKNAIVNTQF